MSARIKVSDGTSWPAPCLDSDQSVLSHVLTYGTPTRADLLAAVQIISAYNYLVLEANRAKRDLVARDIKDSVRNSQESETSAAGPVGSGEEARASGSTPRTAGRQLGTEHQPSSPARQHISTDSGTSGINGRCDRPCKPGHAHQRDCVNYFDPSPESGEYREHG